MICKCCGSDMTLVYADNTEFAGSKHDGKDRAINVYACEHCFTVARENAWANEGTVFVFPNNTIKRYSENPDNY